MSKQEDLLYLKILDILGSDIKILRNYRPWWLKNPQTGKNLEIDIFLPSLRIGFEYQGEQHFKPVHGMSKDIDYTRYKDSLKQQLAWKWKKIKIVEFFESDLTGDFEKIFDERVKLSLAPNRYRKLKQHRSNLYQKRQSLASRLYREKIDWRYA